MYEEYEEKGLKWAGRHDAMAQQVDLDLDADFNMRFVQAMELPGRQGR